MSIIGLTFLTFLSVTVFVCANSTTSSIDSEYNTISSQGNLHDFTVSELYNTGVTKWTNSTQSFSVDGNTYDTSLYLDDHLVMSSDNQLCPYVNAEINTENSTYIFTVYYTIDLDQIDEDSILYSSYLSYLQSINQGESGTNDEYYSPSISYSVSQTDSNATTIYNYVVNNEKAYGQSSQDVTELTSTEITNILQYLDSSEINSELSTDSSTLISLISTTDTPADEYLDQLVDENKITYRNFLSFDIDNSGDDIYYKVIQSNPTDEIDKMVLLDYGSSNDGVQWNNFDTSLCTYDVLDATADDNWSLGETISYLPTSLSGSSEYDIHYIEKVFLLDKCKWGSAAQSSNIYQAVEDIVGDNSVPQTDTERQEFWTENYDKLTNLLQLEHNLNEETYVKDYRTTVQWTSSTGAPTTTEIADWTSYFCVVNPEYMQVHSLRTMDADMYQNELSYKQYVINHPDITNQRQQFIGWLNSQSYDEIYDWFNTTVAESQYSSRIINPNNATPYIIIGSGITPDFIYPIVSIDRSTPNPNSECIIFANDAGYNRLFDSYRSNSTENYIVGKFNSKLSESERQSIIDNINDWASTHMIYPQGTKAAYFATDTSNTLNASAYRISYIPKFIKNVNVVSYTLTIFVLLISIIICAIVIHRYIINSQSTFGIMQANGISWAAIATSILPFALMPAFIGTLGGSILGIALQAPLLSLFSRFWMLPTATIGFNFFFFLILFLIISFVFSIVIYGTTFFVLHKKTVDVMKANSQDNPNIIAKAAKASANRFNVIIRYRIAVAFNSLWKLLVLVIMTALTLSTLVFTISINGKFSDAVTTTDNSRNYSYAIKLITPTNAGGQYIPLKYGTDENGNYVYSGKTGFSVAGNDDRDNDYLQSIYYGASKSLSLDLPIIGTTEIDFPGYSVDNVPNLNLSDISSTNVYKDNESTYANYKLSDALNHNYYYSTYVLDWLNDIIEQPSVNDYIQEFYDALSVNGDMYSNMFLPYMGDTIGEQADMFYLKNRAMTSTLINYTVGVTSLNITSNPWDVASSIMPDSTRNLALSGSEKFINYVGEALYEGQDSSDEEIKALYDRLASLTDIDIDKTFITQTQNPNGTYSYSVNTKTAINQFLSVCLVPDFQKLLAVCYSYEPAASLDYFITYNSVPLQDDEETFTWIDANVLGHSNSSVTIFGIKCDPDYSTKYINLENSNGTNLLSNIYYSYDDYFANKPYPIVINEYAAHKYGLSVGDTISFKINNRADRYEHEIKIIEGSDPDYDNLTNIQFTVAGICNTYEGEEYFIDQDLANYLLGLKSHLFDSNPELQEKYQPNSYYAFEDATLGADGLLGYNLTSDGHEDTEACLINLKNYGSHNPNSDSYYNITPYGFNGVFTADSTSCPILVNNINLYSTTGCYFGSDLLTSNSVFEVLQYGANLKMASDMLLKDSDGNSLNSLADEIDAAYDEWQNSGEFGALSEEAHTKYVDYVTDFLNLIESVYGTQSYTSLLTGAVDATASNLVYSNMSTMVNGLTDVAVITVSLMTIIIVALITNMIINDSKKLAGLLKALGYTDNENALTYLSIYIPVIILGLLLASLLTLGLVSMYNSIIFNGIGIWLNAKIKWYYYFGGFIVVGIIFAISGIAGIYSLKKEKLIETIKN